MRSAVLALLLWTFAGPILAAQYEESVGATFPDRIGKLDFKGRKAFPRKELGFNLAYERDTGFVRASIFIYNAGLDSIPADVHAPVVRKHFDQTVNEVKQLETMGQARAVTLLGNANQTTRFDGCGPQFIWRGYEMNLDGNLLNSYTYLTVVNNHFIKLRISHRDGGAEDQRDIAQFVAEIRKILGRCK